MNIDLDNLNEQQKKAVLYNEGPLLILAGAGSGKTKVLTTKIAYLIEELNISPFEILAITFTNKAALEMRERVDKMIGNVSKNIQNGLKMIKSYAIIFTIKNNNGSKK